MPDADLEGCEELDPGSLSDCFEGDEGCGLGHGVLEALPLRLLLPLLLPDPERTDDVSDPSPVLPCGSGDI